MRYLIIALLALVGCAAPVTFPQEIKGTPEVMSPEPAPAVLISEPELTTVRLVMEPSISTVEAFEISEAAREWELAGCRFHFVVEFSDEEHGANGPLAIRFRHGDIVGHETFGAKTYGDRLLQNDVEIYALTLADTRRAILHEFGHVLNLAFDGPDPTHYTGGESSVMHPYLGADSAHLGDVDVQTFRARWQCTNRGIGRP